MLQVQLQKVEGYSSINNIKLQLLVSLGICQAPRSGCVARFLFFKFLNQNIMLWVLKRTVSMSSFEHQKHMFKLMDK